VLETAFEDLLQAQKIIESNLLGELEALKLQNSTFRERCERFEAHIGLAITLLKNARQVYTTLVTRNVLSDRSILHEIRGEIDKIDEKIKRLREIRG